MAKKRPDYKKWAKKWLKSNPFGIKNVDQKVSEEYNKNYEKIFGKKMGIIRVNKAQCLICGDILESKFRHDYKTCRCGNLSVDGGLDYIKRSAKDYSKVKELSEIE